MTAPPSSIGTRKLGTLTGMSRWLGVRIASETCMRVLTTSSGLQIVVVSAPAPAPLSALIALLCSRPRSMLIVPNHPPQRAVDGVPAANLCMSQPSFSLASNARAEVNLTLFEP